MSDAYLSSPPTDDAPRPRPTLPAPLTPLIGRTRAVAAVVGLIRGDGARLVTLAGPGGVGKTRLALAVAQDLLTDYPDGVWWVPFAAVDEADRVLGVVARALGLRETDAVPIAERLREALAERRALLVLDGFEPVVSAAPVVGDLLAAAAGLTVLVTSRARLRVAGEHDWPVPPLEVAAPHAGADAATAALLGRAEAVRLFVARAREAKADFALTDANAEAVAELCRRLDGLPLAIELAAARTRVLAPAALLARLERRPSLLSGGPGKRGGQGRTLRGAIAWSFDALDPAAQALFCRLAVFVDGFTLEAAEAIWGGAESGVGRRGAATASGVDPDRAATAGRPSDDDPAVLDLLTALGDVSLVRQVAEGDAVTGPRFGLLETVREFGLERLAAAGIDREARNRHAAWCLALAEAADAGLEGSEQAVWLDRLEQDHGNLRVASGWLRETGDGRGVLRLGAALWRFWLMRGHLGEGRQRLNDALVASAPGEPAARARALSGAGALAETQGDYAAAEGLLDEALSAASELRDERSLASARLFRGLLAFDRDEGEAAETLCGGALVEAEQIGDRWTAAVALAQLGLVALRRGDHAAAEGRSREALARFRALENGWGAAVASGALATVELDRGALREMRGHLGASLEGFWAIGDRWGLGAFLEVAARGAMAAGDAARAARLFGAATGLRAGIGAPLKATYRAGHALNVAAARDALGEEAFGAAWAAGRALTVPAAIAEATVAPAEPDAGPAVIQPDSLGAGARLTPREWDVLRLLAEGRSDREIGDALFIGHRTVATHVANILAKMEVPSRTAAATRAVREGLV